MGSFEFLLRININIISRDLRLDSLSQVLNFANVQFGGKYLVMDDTKGLLMGALIERAVPDVSLENGTKIVVVHEDIQFQPNLLKMFNFTEIQLSSLFEIHVRDCVPECIEALEWTQDQDPEKLRLYADKIESRRLKFVEKQQRRLEARSLLDSKNFTSVILAVDPEAYSYESLVDTWANYLIPGGVLVAYSTSKEALNAAFYDALMSKRFTDIRLTESFLRPYQTAEGRMHPHMTCNGHGGFILSMIRIG